MKRFFLVLGTVALLVVLATANAPRAFAQGPIPETLINALNAKNVQMTVRGVATKFYFAPSDAPKYCIVDARIPMTYGSTGTILEITAKFIGIAPEALWTLANEPEFTVTNVDGRWIWMKMYLPPEFCNPPSGTSPAQNPVQVREPHSSHEDPVNFMNWVIAGLIGGIGILLFPKIVRGQVRI